MEVNLHDTTDASAWAKEFCKRWPSALCQIEGKEGVEDGDSFEGIMIGWFANAIMAGVDRERSRIEALTAETERLQARVDELEGALQPFSDMAGEMFARNWNKDGVAVSFVTPDGPIRLTFKEFLNARAALKETSHD